MTSQARCSLCFRVIQYRPLYKSRPRCQGLRAEGIAGSAAAGCAARPSPRRASRGNGASLLACIRRRRRRALRPPSISSGDTAPSFRQSRTAAAARKPPAFMPDGQETPPSKRRRSGRNRRRLAGLGLAQALAAGGAGVRAAHRLKGASRMAGAAVLAEVCEEIERAGRANDWEAIAARCTTSSNGCASSSPPSRPPPDRRGTAAGAGCEPFSGQILPAAPGQAGNAASLVPQSRLTEKGALGTRYQAGFAGIWGEP